MGYQKFHDCIAKDSGTGKCSKRKSGRFCNKHLSQYNLGIIDRDGKKLRDKKVARIKFHDCIAKDSGTGKCSKRKGGSRFCTKHHGQYHLGIIDRDGNQLRLLRPNTGSSKYDRCIAYGKGTRCSKIRNGRFCNKHRGQYYKKIIDHDGNQLRDKKVARIKFDDCIAKDSGTGKCSERKGGRFCNKHLSQYNIGIIDRDGKKLRDKKVGSIKFDDCIAKNSGTGKCSNRRGGSRFCTKHWGQYSLGIIDHDGKKLRDKKLR